MDDKMSNLEIANQNIESLKYYYNNLNKGIDELIKKYEEDITDKQAILNDLTPNTKLEYYYVSLKSEIASDEEFIQDLKKLKGE